MIMVYCLVFILPFDNNIDSFIYILNSWILKLLFVINKYTLYIIYIISKCNAKAVKPLNSSPLGSTNEYIVKYLQALHQVFDKVFIYTRFYQNCTIINYSPIHNCYTRLMLVFVTSSCDGLLFVT